MRHVPLAAFLLGAVSLGACSTWKPPEIRYDDTPRQAHGSRRGFKMAAGRRRRRHLGRLLLRLQRANDGVCTPGLQQGEDEARRVTLRIRHRAVVGRIPFGQSRQFCKTPLPGGSQVAESELMASRSCDLAPALV